MSAESNTGVMRPWWQHISLRRRTLARVGLILFCVLAVVWFWYEPAIVLKGQAIVVGYTSDGKYLATLDSRGKGHIWDAQTGRQRDDIGGQIKGLGQPFSTDGRYHVVIKHQKDPTIFAQYVDASVVETKTASELLSFRSRTSPLGMVDSEFFGFTPDGSRFFSLHVGEGLGQRFVTKIWELPTGREIQTIDMVGGLAISPDGKLLAAYDYEQYEVDNLTHLGIWNIDDARKLVPLELPLGMGRAFATFSSDGKRLALCEGWGNAVYSQLHMMDASSGAELSNTSIPCDSIYSPRFYNHDKLVRLQAHQADLASSRYLQCESVWSTEEDRGEVVWGADSISLNGLRAVMCYQRKDAEKGELTIRVYSVSPEDAKEAIKAGEFRNTSFAKPNFAEFSVRANSSPFFSNRSRISDDGSMIAALDELSGITGTKRVLLLIDGQKRKLARTITIGYEISSHSSFEVAPDGSSVAVSVSNVKAGTNKIKIYSTAH